jgi:hypothetical protein
MENEIIKVREVKRIKSLGEGTIGTNMKLIRRTREENVVRKKEGNLVSLYKFCC